MSRENMKVKKTGPLTLEPRQRRAIRQESPTVGIVKGLIFLLLAAIVYLAIFTHSKAVLDLLTTKTYMAPIVSMSLILIASFLLGSGINKLIKNTLERALETQRMREE